MDLDLLLTHIPVFRYKIRLKVTGKGPLPDFPLVYIRGQLGKRLRNMVCDFPKLECHHCFYKRYCPYPYQFLALDELHRDKVGKETGLPAPVVLSYGNGIRLNSPDLEIYLTMVGSHSQQVIDAMRSLVENNESGARLKVQVLHIQPVSISPFYSVSNNNIGIEILTPMRLKSDGRPVKPQKFSLQIFCRSLLFRLKRLALLYGTPLTKEAFSSLYQHSPTLTEQVLHWKTFTRYSFKQNKNIEEKGLTGYLTINDPGPWLSIFRFGEIIHVGKGAIMGLGQYQLNLISYHPSEDTTNTGVTP